jgi:HNH endonuclease
VSNTSEDPIVPAPSLSFFTGVSSVGVGTFLFDLFWSKVRILGPDECWEWQGSRFSNGYGCFSVDRHTMRAHRVAYQLSNGLIPEGMYVCHHCDNPPCVNPAHLFVGTPQENAHDSIAKGRFSSVPKTQKTHCPRGHPYDEENTYWTKRGHRECRECDRAKGRRIRQERRGKSCGTS